MTAPLRDDDIAPQPVRDDNHRAPHLTVVEPLRPRIEIVAEPAPRRVPNEDPPEPRPTLPRPQLGSTGLFQGWGPRLR